MGASVSVGRLLEELTAEELAESVGSIGRPFQRYGAAILDDKGAIDGKGVSKMSAGELDQAFREAVTGDGPDGDAASSSPGGAVGSAAPAGSRYQRVPLARSAKGPWP